MEAKIKYIYDESVVDVVDMMSFEDCGKVVVIENGFEEVCRFDIENIAKRVWKYWDMQVQATEQMNDDVYEMASIKEMRTLAELACLVINRIVENYLEPPKWLYELLDYYEKGLATE